MTRVLVVDDEPSILRALRINLSAREYDVSTAVDGTTGLAAVARDRPDVIILDLGLPDMDGTEVIHGVRGWTSIPIIVLSAWGQESQKVAALDAGADDYVTKPFGLAELRSRIRAVLRRAGTRALCGSSSRADYRVSLRAAGSDPAGIRHESCPFRLAENNGCARLHDGELLTRDRLARLAEDVGVVERDVRQQDDARVDHVRRVVASAEARLDNGDVDLLLSELRECRRGEDLELRRAFRVGANALDGGFEARVLAGDLDALAPAAHVRRRVSADT